VSGATDAGTGVFATPVPGPLEVTGARTHNLRGIDVTVPHGRITAFTGVSGSGKTSLVIDTVHTEAQLRYLEGFDPYARKLLAPGDRPQVDRIRGLGATLAVDQRKLNRNPRSTLATLTGLDAVVGLLFSRVAPLGGGRTEALRPTQFDPHAPDGMCPVCKGSGEKATADPELIVPSPRLPLLAGGSPWFERRRSTEAAALPSLARHHGTDLDLPWQEQPEEFRHAVLYGTGGTEIEITIAGAGKKSQVTYTASKALDGALAEAERLYATANSEKSREIYAEFVRQRPCPECAGTGLGEIARTVTLGGLTFRDVVDLRVDRITEWSEDTEKHFGPAQREVAGIILPDLRSRVRLLTRLGLGHLQLWRSARTMSGGELQRARFCAQIGSSLTGITYVLDEPGAGLHPADKEHLFAILRELRDAGNTVLLVEHDPDLVARADWVVDLGPGAGTRGGTVVATGTPADIAAHPDSVTGRYLADPSYVPSRTTARGAPQDWLVLHDAAALNVREERIRVPLNRLTCLTGISGSGKSSVLHRILADSVAAALAGRRPETVSRISGLAALRSVTVVDQDAIGRTPRSNPATYTGAYDLIRQLFAHTEEARRHGLKAGAFSFNSAGGRCEACAGLGSVKTDLSFLGETWLTCETCAGRRFLPEVLAVTHRGLTVDEVLGLTIGDAAEHFRGHAALDRILRALTDVGLEYLTLGESATALSGGEAQRLKLARALTAGRTSGERGLVVLDEPLTGLHPADAQRLVRVFDLLLDQGHTVVIAEHDAHMAASADWILDLGPGAGENGGRVLNEGPPRQVARGEGPTAPYLRPLV
jgi:excinuclease ABC subunit A